MVDQRADGQIAITLCNSDAVVTIPMKPGHQPRQDDGAARDLPCAFAAHHADSIPPNDPAALPLPQVATAAYDATRQRALSPERAANLPPATGPPVAA
jgi:hypothetical protein